MNVRCVTVPGHRIISDTAPTRLLTFRSACDPCRSALAVTAIVIGMAVTAVMLAYAIRLYDSKKTLSIDAFTESKW